MERRAMLTDQDVRRVVRAEAAATAARLLLEASQLVIEQAVRRSAEARQRRI